MANQEPRKSNPDWIERQKPCDLCKETIGDEAMYTEAGKRYHMRCVTANVAKTRTVTLP